jgi:hypothetical protein
VGLYARQQNIGPALRFQPDHKFLTAAAAEGHFADRAAAMGHHGYDSRQGCAQAGRVLLRPENRHIQNIQPCNELVGFYNELIPVMHGLGKMFLNVYAHKNCRISAQHSVLLYINGSSDYCTKNLYFWGNEGRPNPAAIEIRCSRFSQQGCLLFHSPFEKGGWGDLPEMK